MKVLILHQHFNTPYDGGAIRSYYLAKALADNGVETVVITGSNSKKGIEKVDGITVHYLPVAYNNSFGFFKRSISFVRFLNGAVTEAGKISDVDLVYAISVPLTVGVAAMRIKKKFKIPFIFEVGDLWPRAPIEMGFIQNPILKTYLLNVEKKIYREAESVVGLSTSIVSDIEKTLPGKNVHLVWNMADTDFYRPQPKDRTLVKKFNAEGKFVVSYIGALGFANGLDHLLDAADAAKDAKLPVEFILCGEGAMRNSLQDRVYGQQLTNVSIYPFRNREGVAEILNVTDAAFISYLPFPVLETGSPNKYFDALAAGKMIITNFGGWIADEIQKEGIGFSYNNNPDDFVSRLVEFLKDNAEAQQAKERSRQLAERKYSRKILAAKFCQIILNTIGPRNH
ncbi:MAG TPA: glycosyltransferase family 4 protein [Chryseosolibacter sp.]